MSPTVVIGFETEPLVGCERFLPEVLAPSNYKDPIKIQEYIIAGQARQLQEAGQKPLTGILRGAKIIYSTGVTGWQSDLDTRTPLGFLDKLYEALKGDDTFDSYVTVFCHRPSQFFQAAYALGLDNNYLSASGLSKFLLPDSRPKIYDPFHLIAGAIGADDPDLVLRRFNINASALSGAADSRAKATEALCKALGLVD